MSGAGFYPSQIRDGVLNIRQRDLLHNYPKNISNVIMWIAVHVSSKMGIMRKASPMGCKLY